MKNIRWAGGLFLACSAEFRMAFIAVSMHWFVLIQPLYHAGLYLDVYHHWEGWNLVRSSRKSWPLSVSGPEQHQYKDLLDDRECRHPWNFQQICHTIRVNYAYQNKEVNRQRDFWAKRICWVKQLPQECLPKGGCFA